MSAETTQPLRWASGSGSSISDKPGHVRTPTYVRGKTGVIETCCGNFENPENRAYGRVGRERIPLYRVRLQQRDLWPDYQGSEKDLLVLEIYQHWLRPA